MSAHISPGCSVRFTIFRMRVPPADTPTFSTRRGPGGKLIVEAMWGGSGYDWDGEALNVMSSLREAENVAISRCAGTHRISKRGIQGATLGSRAALVVCTLVAQRI